VKKPSLIVNKLGTIAILVGLAGFLAIGVYFRCRVLNKEARVETSIVVQPEKPTREYIQKYPVAGGGYQYILVREYELNVEFMETYEGEEK